MQIEDLESLNVTLDRMLKAWRLRYPLEEDRPLTRQGREFIRGVLAEVVDDEEAQLEALAGVGLTDALEIDQAFKTLERILGPDAFVLCTVHHLHRVLRRKSFALRTRDLFKVKIRKALKASRSRAWLTG